MYGLEKEDNRMRDMEYILRFFALSSDAFKDQKKERISLKKFLNQYMKANQKLGEAKISRLRDRFNRSIQFLDKKFGNRSFHNISPSDPTRFVNKFSPTICDSIMIATDIALHVNEDKFANNLVEARYTLLMDDDYRRAISVETMRTSTIKLRITKALKILYGLDYE